MPLKESEILTTHIVLPGESLERIAFDTFQKGEYWKEIATTNELDIFSEIPVGSILQVPTLDVIQNEIDAALPDTNLDSDSFDLSGISSNIADQGLISWVL